MVISSFDVLMNWLLALIGCIKTTSVVVHTRVITFDLMYLGTFSLMGFESLWNCFEKRIVSIARASIQMKAA